MAIRDRFRRALRKSESSDTMSKTESNTTTSASSSLHKSTTSSGMLARTFTWARRSKDDELDKESKRDKKNSKMHPSRRPLTLQNLKHQEMLSHFTMTFGASDPDQIESLSFIGISPCCTRAPSLKVGRAGASSSSSTTISASSSSLTDSPNPDSVRD